MKMEGQSEGRGGKIEEAKDEVGEEEDNNNYVSSNDKNNQLKRIIV